MRPEKGAIDGKNCLSSLMIREMQIQTTLKCHLTSVRAAVRKKIRDKHWQGCGEEGTLVHVGGNVNWFNRYGNSMEVPQKVKSTTAV